MRHRDRSVERAAPGSDPYYAHTRGDQQQQRLFTDVHLLIDAQQGGHRHQQSGIGITVQAANL